MNDKYLGDNEIQLNDNYNSFNRKSSAIIIFHNNQLYQEKMKHIKESLRNLEGSNICAINFRLPRMPDPRLVCDIKVLL